MDRDTWQPRPGADYAAQARYDAALALIRQMDIYRTLEYADRLDEEYIRLTTESHEEYRRAVAGIPKQQTRPGGRRRTRETGHGGRSV